MGGCFRLRKRASHLTAFTSPPQIEHGLPNFFLTFTANEGGWSDLRYACDNDPYNRPVDATRQYHHRWATFNSTFLKIGAQTPVGKLERKWFRQEDQSRGSLHVHAAIWVEGGDAKARETAKNICGTVPRECDTPAEKQWRRFVKATQTHNCRDKCRYKCGEFVGPDFCKFLYPRKRCR